jgi:hypothetical protein
MSRSARKLLVLVILILVIPWAASAQTPIMPGGSCIEVDHFPPQPINNAPSISRFFVALPPEYAGDFIVVMIDGASGPQQGTGPIAPDGLGQAEVPLFSFGPHQVVNLFINNDTMIPVEVDSLVNGGAFTVDESEPACDPDSIVRVAGPTTTTTAATTTTTAATTTTTAATTTTSAPTTTTTAATTAGEGINWLPWLLIALGGLLAIVGLFLLAKKSCDELYRLWQSAQQRYETCMDELTKSQAWLEEKRAQRHLIEQELARLEKSTATGSITEGGTTYQSLPGEGLVTEEGMTSIIESTQAQLESARQTESMGEEMVESWRLETEKAAAEAEAARGAYEDCIGASTATTSETTTTTAVAATGSGPGGVAVATTTQDGGCHQGDRRAVPVADGKTFRVIKAFRIETETQGEAMVGDAGNRMAADLNELGAELGFLGSLLGAHGAGKRVGESLVRTGSAANLVRGGAEGYAAAKGNLGTDSFPVPIPTSPQEVVVGVLQLIAQLAGTVATKANEWMGRRSFVSYRLVREYQMITVRPYTIEECDGQTYRCVERILEYQVGDSGEEPGNWRDGGTGINQMERERQQRELQMLINQGKSAMERSAQALLEFEAHYPPGPC